MRPILVILAAVLLLAGCGAAKDPMVGTWQVVRGAPGDGLVIDKRADGYLLLATDGHRAVSSYRCERRGNELRATVLGHSLPPGMPFTRVMVFDIEASGRLAWTLNGRRVCELVKVSEGTTLRSPGPTASSSAS